MFILKFILIFILVVIVLRILGRLFFFSIVRNINSRMNDHQSSNYRKEGDVFVAAGNATKGKKIKKDEGDYVKYEEIE
jgi:hypothetical protein